MELDRGPRYLMVGMSLVWFVVVLLESKRTGRHLKTVGGVLSFPNFATRICNYALVALALSLFLFLNDETQSWGFAISAPTLSVVATFAALRVGILGSRDLKVSVDKRTERVAEPKRVGPSKREGS